MLVLRQGFLVRFPISREESLPHFIYCSSVSGYTLAKMPHFTANLGEQLRIVWGSLVVRGMSQPVRHVCSITILAGVRVFAHCKPGSHTAAISGFSQTGPMHTVTPY
jgi:hypothetical protein